MTLLLLTLFTAQASPCLSASDLTLEMRTLVDSGPGALESLLGAEATLAEHDLGVMLEVLLVAAQSGDVEVVRNLAAHMLDDIPDELGGPLDDFARDLIGSFAEVSTADELAAALETAQERLGVAPTPEPEPPPPVTFEPEGPTVHVAPPEHAGGSWQSLQEAQARWDAGEVGGAAPIVTVANDYDGGFQAGLDGHMMIIGQPGSYSHEFLNGLFDGHDAR